MTELQKVYWLGGVLGFTAGVSVMALLYALYQQFGS